MCAARSERDCRGAHYLCFRVQAGHTSKQKQRGGAHTRLRNNKVRCATASKTVGAARVSGEQKQEQSLSEIRFFVIKLARHVCLAHCV